jgi:hypothetical protein
MNDPRATSIVDGAGGAAPRSLTSAEKAEAVAHLLDDWLADTSGYDEKTWPVLKDGIESSRLSSRKRFRG